MMMAMLMLMKFVGIALVQRIRSSEHAPCGGHSAAGGAGWSWWSIRDGCSRSRASTNPGSVNVKEDLVTMVDPRGELSQDKCGGRNYREKCV